MRGWILLLALSGCEQEPDTLVDDEPAETEEQGDGCPRLPDEGKCDENTLVLCVDGASERTDCGLDECKLDGDVYACVPRALSNNPEPSDVNGLSIGTGVVTSDRDGLAVIPIEVQGSTSFLATLTAPPDHWLAVTRLVHEDGTEPVLNQPPLSGALFAAREVTFAWPSRLVDAPLKDGLWYLIAQVGFDAFVSRNTDVDVNIAFKDDEDLTQGQLRVAVVWAGYEPGETPEDATAAMQLAYEAWREMYARAGVSLFIDEYVMPDMPRVLEPPGGGGTQAIYDLSAQTDDADVVVVILDDFENVPNEVIGRAGGIPGTPLAGRNAAVGVSWERHAGMDGTFDLVEVSELANTLAHEVGHFLGLFHPVEVTWENFDPLSDTPECESERNCYRVLGDNLMFPVGNCFNPHCEDSTIISAEQAGVMNLYSGTL